ncbi:DNA repair RAD50 [Lecanosticta acicola]|uniref:Efflux pump dotC n=1 Tax=Lecanosticta acicola TaxID=111012 RepID=A0AAI9EFB0_9PEZI|nr:DNA repair RAD50 [Lecanosticta acicola]
MKDIEKQQQGPLNDSTSESKESPHRPEDAGLADESKDNVDEKGSQPPPAPAGGRSRTQIILLMSSLGVAVFLAAVDQVIVATALPAIADSLGASSSTYAWIASSYLIANASSIPIWGRISDIFGRKPSILSANVIFMVGSLISALAHDLTTLIAGRAVQGLGGGGLLVLANICISDIFSLRERGFYLSIVGGVWAIASSIGPLLGGAFAEYVTWRWCFWINLPIDAVSLVGLFFFLDVHNPRTPILDGIKAIDWLGALTSTGGTIMFLLGLDFGGSVYPWRSAPVICLIVFGVVTWALFVLIQWKVASFPLSPLRIFQSRSTAAIMILCFFHAVAFISAVFYLPLYFQAVLGASPFFSGVWILALALPLAVASVVSGMVILKTGHYLGPIIGGMVFLTLGVGLFIDFPDYRSWPRIIIYQIIASLGMGPVFQAPIVALQTKLQPKDIAAGTSAFQFLRQLSSGIGVVIGQVILTSQVRQKASLFTGSGIPASIASQLQSGSLVTAIRLRPELNNAGELDAVKMAYTESLSTMWIFFTCASACGLVASLFIGQQVLTKKHQEFKTGLQTQKT